MPSPCRVVTQISTSGLVERLHSREKTDSVTFVSLRSCRRPAITLSGLMPQLSILLRSPIFTLGPRLV